MNRRGGFLFPAALSLSAAAHLLALFLVPYSPVQPPPQLPAPIPVRLLEAPLFPLPPPARPPAAVKPQVAQPEPKTPAPQPAQPVEPEPEPAAESPLELAPPQPAAVEETETGAAESASPATAAPAVEHSAAALAAEFAATQAVLTSLRSRIVEKIRYPPLARANGWKGTVLLEMLLDAEGRLQGLAVRRSSGYAVLDRAASALVRSITPVDNPLGRPLRIEVPIAYELKD